MRVALVSPPFLSVPPADYGGTELVIAELARSLTKRGHETVVYAPGDSHRVAISANQARKEGPGIAAIVHHGLDPQRFPAMPDQGYLLHIGRYAPEKGTHLAVEIAARAGVPLLLAGQPHDQDYYRDRVQPL